MHCNRCSCPAITAEDNMLDLSDLTSNARSKKITKSNFAWSQKSLEMMLLFQSSLPKKVQGVVNLQVWGSQGYQRPIIAGNLPYFLANNMLLYARIQSCPLFQKKLTFSLWSWILFFISDASKFMHRLHTQNLYDAVLCAFYTKGE